MKKRLLSALLALCMLLTMALTVAFAADEDEPQPSEDSVAYIAENPNVYYTDLDTAIQQAKDNDTIVLLKDATTKGINLSKNITVQGADKLKPTITFNHYGIALWNKALIFKDCNVVMNGIGSTPYTAEWSWMTICASPNASLTLDHVNMTMDANGVTNSPHAIYFCKNNKLNIINGSNLTIKNYPQDALEWDGGDGGYNVNITDSTFVSDHNRSGFTGTFYATITNSDVDVINSTGNGSNGSHFIIKDSNVDFNNNGSHGLSAGELSIDNSTVITNNNKGMGISVNDNFTVKSNSFVEVTGNASNSSYGYAAVRLYNDKTFSVDSTSTLTIKDNHNTGLYVRKGNLTVEDGAKLEITGNKVSNYTLDGYGGGLYVGYGDNYDPSVTLPANAVIYNNHSLVGGDDIYVSKGVEGPSLTFSKVGAGWALDGELDCTDAIDGWYDDSESSRWKAHTAPYHAEEFTAFEQLTGVATVQGLTALKAAHGLQPVNPDDNPPSESWDHSKSKTATNLDENYESRVTLSLPAAEEELVSDVVFVLDKSTSADVHDQILTMLNALNEQVSKTDAKVKVGVVIFNKQANKVLNLTELNESNMDVIQNAIETKIDSGTNTHAGLLAGQAMLDEDTEVAANRKYMVFVSDGITYMYNEEPTATAWSFNQPNAADDWHGTGSWGIFAGPDNWYSKYHTNNAPENWSTWLAEISTKVSAQGETYEYKYNDGVSTATNKTAEDIDNWDTAYAMSIDKALYLTNQVYQEMQAKGYKCYAMTATTAAKHPWAESFMNYLSGGQTVSFDDIQKAIYYLLDAGSKVVDVIGTGTDNYDNSYDFDFVDPESLNLTVGDTELTPVPLIDPQFTDNFVTGVFGFVDANGSKDSTTYPYVLRYYANGQDGKSDECFVWEINVPVSNFAPVQLTYTVKLTNPQTTAGTYGQYDADGSEKYDGGLYTNNEATLYPVDSNGNQGVPENFAKPTVSYSAGTVTITPVDMTIYTGGDGYAAVDNGQTTPEIGNGTDGEEGKGLPTPGFYLTLPAAVNQLLAAEIDDNNADEISGGYVDLTGYLTFVYDYNGETRKWPLAAYNIGEDYANVSSTTADERYVYRLLPAEVNGVQVPIRLQFKALDDAGNPVGEPIISDDFDASATKLYDKYNMTIYPGALDQGHVQAQITIGDETYTLGVEVGNGTLTVRGVDDTTPTVDVPVTTNTEAVADNNQVVDKTTGTTITAVAQENANYYINANDNVTVNPANVHLLADGTLENQNALETYLLENDHADRNDTIQYQYLDLVDVSNGRTFVVSSKALDIYWKIPSDANVNGEFRLVHFTGMDREYEGAHITDTISDMENDFVVFSTNPAEGEEKLEKVQIDGAWYLRFATQDFSPFALIYDKSSSGGGGGGGSSRPNTPDDLNTEDHYAYIIGYPKDYRTGKPSNDESLWPVEPQGDITRAEVATIFFRMLTDDARDRNWSQTNSFTDVAATSWYNNAISTLTHMGILSGDPDGSFRPDESITRAEFTKIAVSFFDKTGNYVAGTYSDVSANAWYADFIDAAVDLGLIEGYPDGTIRPQASITRAEACTIVNRTLGRVPDKDHLLSNNEMRVWPDNSNTNAWYYAQIQEATNSHDYEWISQKGEQIENWTDKLADRDWAALEKQWSNANSAPGGEVMD